MKTFFLFATLLLSSHSSFAAWSPTMYCDEGTLEIDQSSDERDTYQIVLRGNVANWIVNEAKLVQPERVNGAGEIIQKYNANRYYERFATIYTGIYRHDIKVTLENFPPRLEAYSYDPKFGSTSPKQTYYFNNCRM